MIAYSTYPDTELLRLLAQDDQQAFEALYTRYWEELYKTAFFILKDKEACKDIRQAMKIVCAASKNMNIDTARIGLLGFSAGGHLVAMAATAPADIHPAFTILVYPVISFMDSLTSKTSSSRSTLLGKSSSLADKIAFSPELHVSHTTPPAFIVQAEDDSTSLVGNSMAYYHALVANRVAGQLLLYQEGSHGFALYNKAEDEYWMPAAIKWLALNGFYTMAAGKTFPVKN